MTTAPPDAPPPASGRALAAIVQALARYPAPVRLPERPSQGGETLPRLRSVSPLEAGVDLYARHVQGTPEDAEACEAFAAVAPRVFARVGALITRTVVEVANVGGASPEAYAERRALAYELSTLATIFVATPGRWDDDGDATSDLMMTGTSRRRGRHVTPHRIGGDPHAALYAEACACMARLAENGPARPFV